MIYAAVLLWCILRGLVEGMVMVQFSDPMYGGDPDKNDEGVRCHRWFRWYHWLCIARDAALVALVLAIMNHHFRYISEMVLITGVLFIGWQLFEMTYNFTRYGRVLQQHENFLGIKYFDGNAVMVIHAARVLIGLALIIGGIIWTG